MRSKKSYMEHHPSELEKYIKEHIDKEPELLARLNLETHSSILFPRMISGHIQGRLLSMLCKMIQPKRILEIGTFTGYSALSMAEAIADDACIDTCEINDELEAFIQRYFNASVHGHKIKLHIGDACKLIPSFNAGYDLAFIDGNKRLYCEYLQLVLTKLKPGGFIIADNTLWDGKVVEEPNPGDLQTMGVLEFNDMVAKDDRLEKVILPLRDGLTLIRKKIVSGEGPEQMIHEP